MPSIPKPPKPRKLIIPKGKKHAQRARINLGPPPLEKSEAWRVLSREAKQLLQAKRKQGFFGGMPGKAPYWMAQESGEPKAQIVGQHYIAKALRKFEKRAGIRVREWVVSLGRG